MIQTFATESQAKARLATIDITRWPQARVCRILNPRRQGTDAFLIRLTAWSPTNQVLGASGEAEGNAEYFTADVGG